MSPQILSLAFSFVLKYQCAVADELVFMNNNHFMNCLTVRVTALHSIYTLLCRFHSYLIDCDTSNTTFTFLANLSREKGQIIIYPEPLRCATDKYANVWCGFVCLCVATYIYLGLIACAMRYAGKARSIVRHLNCVILVIDEGFAHLCCVNTFAYHK